MRFWKRPRPAEPQRVGTVHELLTRPGLTVDDIAASLDDMCGGFTHIAAGSITAEKIAVDESSTGRVNIVTGDKVWTFQRDELAP